MKASCSDSGAIFGYGFWFDDSFAFFFFLGTDSDYFTVLDAASFAAWVCLIVFCLLSLVIPMPLTYTFLAGSFESDSLSSPDSSPPLSSLSSSMAA
jgi:hypothetical protein